MRNCAECKERRFKEGSIDRWDHEQEVLRLQYDNKRLWVTNVILICMLFVMAVSFFVFETKIAKVRIEQDSESGYNNYICNDGDIYNGEADSNSPIQHDWE